MVRMIGIPGEASTPTNIPAGGLQSAIRPPNLTDTSFRGLYAATTVVPNRAIRALNQVSARIGAPALSGAPPTAMVVPSGGGGAKRPFPPLTTIRGRVNEALLVGRNLLRRR